MALLAVECGDCSFKQAALLDSATVSRSEVPPPRPNESVMMKTMDDPEATFACHVKSSVFGSVTSVTACPRGINPC